MFLCWNDENLFPSKVLKSKQNKSEPAICLSTCFPFIFQVMEINISPYDGTLLFFTRMMYTITCKSFLLLNLGLLLNVLSLIHSYKYYQLFFIFCFYDSVQYSLVSLTLFNGYVYNPDTHFFVIITPLC